MANYTEVDTNKKGEPETKTSVYPQEKFLREYAVMTTVDGVEVPARNEDGTIQYKPDAPKIVAEQNFLFQKVGDDESPSDWLAQYVPNTTVQRDLINRAVILKQQQKAGRLLQSDDFAPQPDSPIDLGQYLNDEAERVTGDPKTKAIRNMVKAFGLGEEESADVQRLLAQFAGLAAAAAASAAE